MSTPRKEAHTELAVEHAVIKLAREVGGRAYKFTSPARRAVPDRMVLVPTPCCPHCLKDALIFFVECKASGRKATVAQQREHTLMRKAGSRVYVVDSPAAAREVFVREGLLAPLTKRVLDLI